MELEAHLGEGAAEGLQEARHLGAAAGDLVEADVQRAELPLRNAPRAEPGILDPLENVAAVFEEGRARPGEADAARLALEKRRAHLGLEIADLPPERGLRQVQPLGRPVEVQLFRDGQKVAEMTSLQHLIPQRHRPGQPKVLASRPPCARQSGRLRRVRRKGGFIMTGRLAGRKIVITGAGSGIGRESARQFAREGATLALIDRDEAAAQVTADETGGHVFALDVTDEAAVETVVGRAAEALGGIDGLLNSAGILTMKTVDDIGVEEFRRVVDVNLTGTFLVCQAALPWLRKEPKAAIVNIASAQALLPSLTGSAYAASKAAVMMFSKSIAKELAPAVRVNIICPGATETPMTDQGVAPDDVAGRKALAAVYAMNRLAQPEEIAAGILFLMSDEAAAITGVALAIDNGRTFH